MIMQIMLNKLRTCCFIINIIYSKEKLSFKKEKKGKFDNNVGIAPSNNLELVSCEINAQKIARPKCVTDYAEYIA